MTDKEEKKRILIKKVNAGHHDGAHGGAWKIAYADFVTAMMAFFLLMWLLNSVEEDKLQGIAEYFQTPISEMGKGGPGLTNTARIVDAGGGDKQSSKAGEIQGRPNAMLKDSQASSDTDKAQLEALKKNLEETIMLTPTLAPFKNQIKIEITDETSRIFGRKLRPKLIYGVPLMKRADFVNS